MTPEQKIKLKKYTRAIAEILYTEGESEQKPTLESIEKTIQAQQQPYVSPEIAAFFKQSTGTTAGRTRKLTSTLGLLTISEKQAQLL